MDQIGPTVLYHKNYNLRYIKLRKCLTTFEMRKSGLISQMVSYQGGFQRKLNCRVKLWMNKDHLSNSAETVYRYIPVSMHFAALLWSTKPQHHDDGD